MQDGVGVDAERRYHKRSEQCSKMKRGCGGFRYSFATVWPIQLNEVTPGLQEKLCPTDCRLRPDQRFTELGMYDEVCLWPCAAIPHTCDLPRRLACCTRVLHRNDGSRNPRRTVCRKSTWDPTSQGLRRQPAQFGPYRLCLTQAVLQRCNAMRFGTVHLYLV